MEVFSRERFRPEVFAEKFSSIFLPQDAFRMVMPTVTNFYVSSPWTVRPLQHSVLTLLNIARDTAVLA